MICGGEELAPDVVVRLAVEKVSKAVILPFSRFRRIRLGDRRGVIFSVSLAERVPSVAPLAVFHFLIALRKLSHYPIFSFSFRKLDAEIVVHYRCEIDPVRFRIVAY